MLVRTKVFRNKDGSTRTYLQIVKGERVEGKVRQKVVANLGWLEHLEKGGLDRLVEGLARFSGYQLVKDKARKLEARWAKTWGPALVFRRLCEELGLQAVLGYPSTGPRPRLKNASMASTCSGRRTTG
jgi:hypothetical protein